MRKGFSRCGTCDACGQFVEVRYRGAFGTLYKHRNGAIACKGGGQKALAGSVRWVFRGLNAKSSDYFVYAQDDSPTPLRAGADLNIPTISYGGRFPVRAE